MFAWKPLGSLSICHVALRRTEENSHHCTVQQDDILSTWLFRLRHLYGHFPLVLQCKIFFLFFLLPLSLSPPFSPSDCSMWQSELCVITQQEKISLPHICCQGSAKNGAVLGLSDLTTSHRAPELPTPGWGKSNTTS